MIVILKLCKGGITAVYPVFAQNQPESRCPTVLDTESYSQYNFTFAEYQNLTGVKTEGVFKQCAYLNKTSLFEQASKFSSVSEFTEFVNSAEQDFEELKCERTDAIFDNRFEFKLSGPRSYHSQCCSLKTQF